MSTWTNPTTTDHAAQLRAALKAKGITSKMVSVRSESFSMGSAIRVTVKDPAVSIALVNELAKDHERIDRCAHTGEILSGCNRYVTVSVSAAVEQFHQAAWLPKVEAALAQIAETDDNRLMPVEGTEFLVGRNRRGGLSLWLGGAVGSHLQDGWEPATLARAIGARVVAMATA